jgi:hypothetical protein
VSISPEHLAIGQEAYKQIKKYEILRKKLLIAYLIPLGWLANSIVHYEIKASSWNLFLIIFWAAVLVYIMVMTFKKRRDYLHSLATLERLQKQYGTDISFGEENIAADAGEKVVAIKEHEEWRKLKPLFAFGIFLAAVFILPLIFHYFRVAFSK